MSRIQSLASRPKRTLGALAVVLAAVGITVGSGANFTASQANAGNVFTTGSLSVGDSASGAFMETGLMVPGNTRTGTVDISNTGDVPGNFGYTQTIAPGSSAALAAVLKERVLDCGIVDATHNPDCVTGASEVYPNGGPTTNLPSNFGGSLGTWAKGETHRFKFIVSLPQATGNKDASNNPLEGQTVTVDLGWSAATV